MILVIKDSEVIYSLLTEDKVEAIRVSDTLFGIVPLFVREPQAIKLDGIAYVISFSAMIPEHLHIRPEFSGASILILDDFELYGDKVKSYYAAFSKEELFQEVLKYRIVEVTNGNASTVI